MPIMPLILGSQSPRRREILDYFSFPFKQVPSSFDEESVSFEGDPIQYAHLLSKEKAQMLAEKFPNDMIVTADTVVYRSGKIYGKPRDEREAFTFLKELSGCWHSVYTSLTLQYKAQQWQDMTETCVLFNPLTDEQIQTYYQKLHCADKAGGYMIQQAGGIIVKRVDGCYYNVMGLSINSLRSLLLNLGIDLWNYLK